MKTYLWIICINLSNDLIKRSLRYNYKIFLLQFWTPCYHERRLNSFCVNWKKNVTTKLPPRFAYAINRAAKILIRIHIKFIFAVSIWGLLIFVSSVCIYRRECTQVKCLARSSCGKQKQHAGSNYFSLAEILGLSFIQPNDTVHIQNHWSMIKLGKSWELFYTINCLLVLNSRRATKKCKAESFIVSWNLTTLLEHHR